MPIFVETDCSIDFTEDLKKMDECTKRIIYQNMWMRDIFLGGLLAIAVFFMMYVIYRKCIARKYFLLCIIE